MKLNYGLEIKQSQKLLMTPQLKQAIHILQLPCIELEKFINEQLLENPMLEMEDESPSYEAKFYEYLANDYGHSREMGEAKEDLAFENFICREDTLQEHLRQQLLFLKDDSLRNICEYIIDNIDDNGYFCVTIQEVVEVLSVDRCIAEKSLEVVRSLEPAGVGAKDLPDCLLLQLFRRGMGGDPETKLLINEFLSEMAEGNIDSISNKTGIGTNKISEVINLLKELTPKPGINFSSNDNIKYISHDIVIERVGDEFEVIVNDTISSRLFINPLYRRLLVNGEGYDVETKRYVTDRLNAARWVVRSVEQRRITLYRVAECIADHQKEFLFKGIEYIKPLTLKQVAERVNIHESTVSRAISDKYAQTPLGLFPLKFFFNSGIKSSEGFSSSRCVKEALREYIKNETAGNPYTDQQLTDLLQERGYHISRRTVAKYRTELGIETAGKRKKIKENVTF